VLLSLLLAISHSITHSFGFVVDAIPSLSKRESTYKRLKLNACRITLSLTKWAKAWSNAINDNEETLDFATEAYMVYINHLRKKFSENETTLDNMSTEIENYMHEAWNEGLINRRHWRRIRPSFKSLETSNDCSIDILRRRGD